MGWTAKEAGAGQACGQRMEKCELQGTPYARSAWSRPVSGTPGAKLEGEGGKTDEERGFLREPETSGTSRAARRVSWKNGFREGHPKKRQPKRNTLNSPENLGLAPKNCSTNLPQLLSYLGVSPSNAYLGASMTELRDDWVA